MSVWVRKEWENDNEKTRPRSIKVRLSNGMSVTLTKENGWTGVISNLPAYINGEPAVYTWTEADALGYQQKSVETKGNMTVITNEPFTRNDSPKKGKKPKLPGETVELEDYETPLGVEVIINHVGDCFD